MGLDMYLTAEKYLWSFEHNEREEITAKIGNIPGDYEVKSFEIELMYWRKANAIHQWFVDNCQGGIDECQKSYVDIDDLKKLHKLCCDVLANKTFAEELLPVQSGFFFGSYEYDEYYYSDLSDTKSYLEEVLMFDWNKLGYNLHYHSSW